MKLIRPTAITPEMITTCNVPETDFPGWSGLTPYVIGDNCLSNHKNYECLVDNTNYLPESNTADPSPKWLDLGYDNRWSMLDEVVGTQTSNAETITLTVSPGQIDSIAFLDLDAVTITMVMTDPIEGEVFNNTIELADLTSIEDWYVYFLLQAQMKKTAVAFDLPPFSGASVAVTISNPGGTAKVGTLVFGNVRLLGGTQYGASVGITDYSTKEADTWGNYVIVERAWSKRLDCDLSLPNTIVDSVHALLAEYRARPVVWVGADSGFDCMIIYGFFKSFFIVVAYAMDSTCNLEIEGLA